MKKLDHDVVMNWSYPETGAPYLGSLEGFETISPAGDDSEALMHPLTGVIIVRRPVESS